MNGEEKGYERISSDMSENGELEEFSLFQREHGSKHPIFSFLGRLIIIYISTINFIILCSYYNVFSGRIEVFFEVYGGGY